MLVICPGVCWKTQKKLLLRQKFLWVFYCVYIYNFGKVSNLVVFNGLKHSLEGIYWCKYTQVGMASNRLAVPLLLCPKSKIINVVGRRVWTATPHFLWHKSTFCCSKEEGIVQHQSSVWGESNVKTCMNKNNSADVAGVFYQNTFRIIIVTSH